MISCRPLTVLALVSLASACAGTDPVADDGAPPPAPLGVVSSAHPIATHAGIEILEAGGNAFDAAVAIAATLNVVEPMMSGMGGYGTILTFEAATGQARFLNASDRIPRAVNADVYREPTPDYLDNRRGAKAVSTPGNVRAWEALASLGELPFSRLLTPAIHTAEAGFMVNASSARLIANAFNEFPDHAKAFYGRDGEPLGESDLLVQTDLARSLQLLAAEGPSALYGGVLGQAIDAAIRDAGGFLNMQDLVASKAEWWEPIAIDYRGFRVMTASPPSTAFPSLVRLGLMSRFEVAALGHNSPEYLHTFAEVTKHAFWTRLAYAGDPEIRPPPLDRLLSEGYWRQQAKALSPDRARPFEYPDMVANEPLAGLHPAFDQHTTHFVVADSAGNVVSATQTLGNSFGARIMPEGTGIWLNNSLAYCTFEPPGNPMDAHPGRRKLSGDAPTFILRDGKVWIALGTPGGHTIGQTVPQMVINLIDFEMGLQEALDAPRVSFIEPDSLAVEERIPESVRSRLEALGHNLRTVGGLGNAHALAIEYDAGGHPIRFVGAADRRGVGSAEVR